MKKIYFLAIMLTVSVLYCGCKGKEKGSGEVNGRETEKTEGSTVMKLTSSAFANGEKIPPKYTADGADISPPLVIEGVPEYAKSLVLIVDDPDAPMGTWDHWIVWNIAPDCSRIYEAETSIGISGNNGWNKLGYRGPAPPSGTHRYFFKLYALKTMLDLKEGSSKKQLEAAMEGNIIAEAGLMGKYARW